MRPWGRQRLLHNRSLPAAVESLWLKALDDLRSILKGRAPFYEKADAVLDTSRQPLDQSLALLKQTVDELFQLQA